MESVGVLNDFRRRMNVVERVCIQDTEQFIEL